RILAFSFGRRATGAASLRWARAVGAGTGRGQLSHQGPQGRRSAYLRHQFIERKDIHMRALVIEDDAALREQVVQFLSEEGFAVDAAADGEQGLYMAEEYPADIAIVDLGLPGVPGIDIVRKARDSGRKYPILILTARDGW